jgi:DNA-binding protein H-NS
MEKQMAKSLAQVQKQIAKLQKEAEEIKAKEAGGVIARIKDAIQHYGLKPADLFGAASKAGRPVKARKAVRRKSGAAKKAPLPVKFRDDAGHTWSGRGKRPNWFNAALAAGKSPADFLVK